MEVAMQPQHSCGTLESRNKIFGCTVQELYITFYPVLRGRALLGCTRGSFWARSARLGSSRFLADSAAVGVTSIARSSGGRRQSRGCRVVSSLAHGPCGTRVAGVRLRVVAAGPVAGCGSGPWGVTHASHKGAA